MSNLRIAVLNKDYLRERPKSITSISSLLSNSSLVAYADLEAVKKQLSLSSTSSCAQLIGSKSAIAAPAVATAASVVAIKSEPVPAVQYSHAPAQSACAPYRHSHGGTPYASTHRVSSLHHQHPGVVGPAVAVEVKVGAPYTNNSPQTQLPGTAGVGGASGGGGGGGGSSAVGATCGTSSTGLRSNKAAKSRPSGSTKQKYAASTQCKARFSSIACETGSTLTATAAASVPPTSAPFRGVLDNSVGLAPGLRYSDPAPDLVASPTDPTSSCDLVAGGRSDASIKKKPVGSLVYHPTPQPQPQPQHRGLQLQQYDKQQYHHHQRKPAQRTVAPSDAETPTNVEAAAKPAGGHCTSTSTSKNLRRRTQSLDFGPQNSPTLVEPPPPPPRLSIKPQPRPLSEISAPVADYYPIEPGDVFSGIDCAQEPALDVESLSFLASLPESLAPLVTSEPQMRRRHPSDQMLSLANQVCRLYPTQTFCSKTAVDYVFVFNFIL